MMAFVGIKEERDAYWHQSEERGIEEHRRGVRKQVKEQEVLRALSSLLPNHPDLVVCSVVYGPNCLVVQISSVNASGQGIFLKA